MAGGVRSSTPPRRLPERPTTRRPCARIRLRISAKRSATRRRVTRQRRRQLAGSTHDSRGLMSRERASMRRASAAICHRHRSRSRGSKCTFPGRRVTRTAGSSSAASVVDPIARGRDIAPSSFVRLLFPVVPREQSTAPVAVKHPPASTHPSRRPCGSIIN